jgi:Asp-tRNA(Asn)/Glu-tRNA(Gln) amidotransferase A subunit family amidase
LGLQLMGRYWEEDLLLRLAYAAEKVVERQTPQVFYKIL